MTESVVDVDALARRLMVRMVDQTPLAPSLESILEGRTAIEPSDGLRGAGRGRRSFVAAVASIVLIAVGLGFVTQLRNPDRAASMPTSKQLPSMVPEGWVLDRVLGPGTYQDVGFAPDVTLFATEQAPLGPIVAVDQRGTFSGSAGTDAVETETNDGRRVVLSDSRIKGIRTVDFQVRPTTWVTLLGRGVPDATLIRLAATATVTPDGFAELDVSVVAAAGLTRVGAGRMANLPFGAGRDSDPASMPVGLTVTSYTSPDVSGHIDLNTYTATPFERAALGLLFAPTVSPDDPEGWMRVATGLDSTAGWFLERDGFAHVITGPAGEAVTMRQILEELRPVDDGTWDQQVSSEPATGLAATTVVVDETIAPPMSPDEQRIEVETRVESFADGRYRLSLTDPTGTAKQLDARYTGRSIAITQAGADDETFTVTQDIGNVAGPSVAAQISNTGVLALVVVPITNQADHAEITIAGTTYVVRLEQLNDAYPIATAAVIVDSVGRADIRVALTAKGRVIETL